MKSQIIPVRIVCTELPDPTWDGHSEIWLGVQLGKNVEQVVRLPIGTAEFTLEIERVAKADGLDFRGAAVHGKRGERFLYLCWGQPTAAGWIGFRRAKLPLNPANFELAHAIVGQVRATDAKGGPVCATLKAPYLVWSTEPLNPS